MGVAGTVLSTLLLSPYWCSNKWWRFSGTPPSSCCFDFRYIHEEIEFQRLISHCSKVRHIEEKPGPETWSLTPEPCSPPLGCDYFVGVQGWWASGYQLHGSSRCQNRVEVGTLMQLLIPWAQLHKGDSPLFYFPWKFSNKSKVKRIPKWSPCSHRYHHGVSLVSSSLSECPTAQVNDIPSVSPDVQCPENPFICSKQEGWPPSSLLLSDHVEAILERCIILSIKVEEGISKI